MRVRNIAVIVIGLDEEYQYNVIRGINQYAREHDVNISYFAAFGGVVDSRKFDLGEFSTRRGLWTASVHPASLHSPLKPRIILIFTISALTTSRS